MEMEFKLNHMSRLIREARGLSLVATALFALTACGGSDDDGGGNLGITAPGDGSGTGGDTGGGDTGGGDTGGGDTGGGDTGGGDTGGGEEPAPEPEEPKPITYAFNKGSAIVMVDGSMTAHGYKDGSANAFARILGEFDGTSPVTNVVFSRGMDSFAAQREDGVALVWGNRNANHNTSPGSNIEETWDSGRRDGDNVYKLTNVKEIDSGEANLVVTHTDGTVSVFGRGTAIDKPSGVDLTGVDTVTSLCPDLEYIPGVQNGSRAFAAIKADGSVVAWGTTADNFDAGFPGGEIGDAAQYLDGTVPVTDIACLDNSVGKGGWALRQDGAVVTWGTETNFVQNAGVAKLIDLGVNTVVIGDNGSVALARDVDGFNSADFAGYTVLEASYDDFKDGLYQFRVEKDGMQKIMFYSELVNGSFDIDSDDKVKSVDPYGDLLAQVFITENGKAHVAGSNPEEGAVRLFPASFNGMVESIAMTPHGDAGVAKLADGTVQAWGLAVNGGDTSSVAAELAEAKVTAVGSGRYSLYALNENGKVIGWGDLQRESVDGGVIFDSAAVDGTIPVQSIYQNTDRHNVIALRTDGAIISWGEAATGGDMSSVADQFDSKVSKVATSAFGYVALLETGKAVYWGAIGCPGEQEVCDLFDANNNYANIMRVGNSVLTYRGDRSAIALHTDGSKLP